MISFNQFISRYSGRYVDWDNKYGYQCVDLIRQYVYDVFGLSPYVAIPYTGNAKDIFNRFPASGNKYFIEIEGDEKSIEMVINEFGLQDFPVEKRSYLEILMEKKNGMH